MFSNKLVFGILVLIGLSSPNFANPLLPTTTPQLSHYRKLIDQSQLELSKVDQFKATFPSPSPGSTESPFFVLLNRLHLGLSQSIEQMDLYLRMLSVDQNAEPRRQLSAMLNRSESFSKMEKIVYRHYLADLSEQHPDEHSFTYDSIQHRLVELEHQLEQLRFMMEQEMGVAQQAVGFEKTLTYPGTLELLMQYSRDVSAKATKFLREFFHHTNEEHPTFSNDMILFLMQYEDSPVEQADSIPFLVSKLTGKIVMLAEDERERLVPSKVTNQQQLIQETQRIKVIELSMARDMEQLKLMIGKKH